MNSKVIKSRAKSKWLLMKSNMTELYILVPKGSDDDKTGIVVNPGEYVSNSYEIGDQVKVEIKYFHVTQDAVSICN